MLEYFAMAYQPKRASPGTRNEQTHAQIRRDTWLQMIAPLVLATIVMLALLALVIAPAGAGVRRPLADVAILLLILPTLLIGLIMLALLLGLNYGVFFGLTRLPPYSKLAQDYVVLAADRVKGALKKASDAVIATRGAVAATRRVANDLGALLPFQRRD